LVGVELKIKREGLCGRNILLRAMASSKYIIDYYLIFRNCTYYFHMLI